MVQRINVLQYNKFMSIDSNRFYCEKTTPTHVLSASGSYGRPTKSCSIRFLKFNSITSNGHLGDL